MDAELLKWFGSREERLTVAGREIVVKTLPEDAPAFKAGDDTLYQFAVRCTFYEDGKPAFTDDDIPVLRKAPSVLTLPLFKALERVNGMDAFAEVKNSEAAPSSG